MSEIDTLLKEIQDKLLKRQQEECKHRYASFTDQLDVCELCGKKSAVPQWSGGSAEPAKKKWSSFWDVPKGETKDAKNASPNTIPAHSAVVKVGGKEYAVTEWKMDGTVDRVRDDTLVVVLVTQVSVANKPAAMRGNVYRADYFDGNAQRLIDNGTIRPLYKNEIGTGGYIDLGVLAGTCKHPADLRCTTAVGFRCSRCGTNGVNV